MLARWSTPEFASTVRANRLRAQLTATPAEGYAGCCEAIAAIDLHPLLGRIQAPTLIIAGADDPATPPDHATVITEAIAGARQESFRGWRTWPA